MLYQPESHRFFIRTVKFAVSHSTANADPRPSMSAAEVVTYTCISQSTAEYRPSIHRSKQHSQSSKTSRLRTLTAGLQHKDRYTSITYPSSIPVKLYTSVHQLLAKTNQHKIWHHPAMRATHMPPRQWKRDVAGCNDTSTTCSQATLQ